MDWSRAAPLDRKYGSIATGSSSGDRNMSLTVAETDAIIEPSSSIDMDANFETDSRPAHHTVSSKKRGRHSNSNSSSSSARASNSGSLLDDANITRSSAAVVIEDDYDDGCEEQDDEEDEEDEDDEDDDDYDPYDYDPCSGSDHAHPDPPLPSPATATTATTDTNSDNSTALIPAMAPQNLPWKPQNLQSTCEFTHTITNYSQKRESGCKKAEYSATTVDNCGNRWRLIIYVNGNGRASNHHLSLFLQVGFFQFGMLITLSGRDVRAKTFTWHLRFDFSLSPFFLNHSRLQMQMTYHLDGKRL